MNQRAGKMHAASGYDNGVAVGLQPLIRTVRQCQEALEQAGEEDSALRFEIFADYLQDHGEKKGISFNMRMLGL